MSDDDKQPVEKLADQIVKDDVAKNGGKGRPGKEPKHVAVSPRLPGAKYAIPGAVVLAGLIAVVVVALLGGFGGGAKAPAASSTLTATASVPVAPVPPATATSVDACLVGTWRSSPLLWRVVLPAQTAAGGADVLVTFKPDGTEIVDMSHATPHIVGATNTYRGMTLAKIEAKGGMATATLERSSASVHTVYAASVPPIDKTQPAAWFAFALGGNPSNRRYAVTETTLTYDPTPLATMRLRRISPPPPAGACETGVPRTTTRTPATTTP